LLVNAEKLGGKILSIHSRGAVREDLNSIEKNVSNSLPILHWFSGSPVELERAVGLGCWFSVGPAMLRSQKGRELALAIPPDRLLTETDGPFGTNGVDPLMPWDASLAIPVIAGGWGCAVSEAEQRIGASFRKLVETLKLTHVA
jgi:TatD DNase family protein